MNLSPGGGGLTKTHIRKKCFLVMVSVAMVVVCIYFSQINLLRPALWLPYYSDVAQEAARRSPLSLTRTSEKTG
jgi:hypothetical protein